MLFVCLLGTIVSAGGKSVVKSNGGNTDTDVDCSKTVCADPNQECKTNVTTAPCAMELCDTFQFPSNSSLCPHPAVALYPVRSGCVCKTGFAWVSAYKCAEKDTCDCPEIADYSDPRFYYPIN